MGDTSSLHRLDVGPVQPSLLGSCFSTQLLILLIVSDGSGTQPNVLHGAGCKWQASSPSVSLKTFSSASVWDSHLSPDPSSLWLL